MFSDYALPYYNVNNRRCAYPEIETLYAFSLVLQEAVLNVEDLERSICSLGYLEQQIDINFWHVMSLYTSERPRVY